MTMKKMLQYILLSVCLQTLTGCQKTAEIEDTDSVFEYREIYLPEQNTKDTKKLKLNLVDNEWGIWGHHLKKVLPKNPSLSVFATIGGRNNDEQFCFMSDKLFQYIEAYIHDNYGATRSQRFAILPNDNGLVCQCEQCRRIGCTTKNATPAVMHMLERLSHRFPAHTFFTSYYLTTRSVPAKPMPVNTGVLISAMDYDLNTKVSAKELQFENLLRRWGGVTKNIYVWDYINNFDDYFTPFPVFNVMQRRFKLFAKTGVRGVFLNGSGSDYSTFSRLKTYVLAAMLRDPECDWKKVLEEKCMEFYPVTGKLIAQYIMKQEAFVVTNGKPLPLYEGVATALKHYLNEQDFVDFHNQLILLLPKTQGEERKEITRLNAALMLTRLEIRRLHGDTRGCKAMLEQLQRIVQEDVRIYSESYWTVESYIKDFQVMLQEAEEVKGKNLLQGLMLTPLTALDPDYSDISILTDGLAGIPSNYHCGQMISSADPSLKIAIPHVDGMKRLRVGLTYNAQFHIALPLSVSLMAGDNEIETIKPQQQGISGRYVAEFNIPASANRTLVLVVTRNKEERTMAIDEVTGL